MTTRLGGINGTNLLGFMCAVSVLALLDDEARRRSRNAPRLSFGGDGAAVIHTDLADHQLPATLMDELKKYREALNTVLESIEVPADVDRALANAVISTGSRQIVDLVSGLAVVIGEDGAESTLCAATGAGHQKLVVSMRDVLSLVEEGHIEKALFRPWARDFSVPKSIRAEQGIGTRKPTLRLEPGDERIYALRASNPTTADDYTTELGAQALAVPAFAQMPVVPRARPVTVASDRRRNKVYFQWALWDCPADLRTVRSIIATGAAGQVDLRARGGVMAFRVARVAGEKGKLSFAPPEGLW